MSESKCPRCGAITTEFMDLDSALVAKLKESGINEAFPQKVCSACFAKLAGSVARGSVLLAREKAKENKKLMLWKNRVALIKKARQYMNDKMFSDAAVNYEKYIKVLEVVFDCKTGELSPEMFKDSARTQELTVVTSVFWDLLRIYDTSPKYGERMQNAAKKLTVFVRYTPIYPDIVRKAEAFQKTAKNPNIVKSFLKEMGEEKGKCFIATSAFDSPFALEVVRLSNFRDQFLTQSAMGRLCIKTYYLFSPAIAVFLDNNAWLKPGVRIVLRIVIKFLKCK